MDSPAQSLHLARQSLGVGRSQLRNMTPLQDEFGDLVSLSRQALQNTAVGCILPARSLLAALQLETLEQHFSQLLRRREQESPSRQRDDSFFQRRSLLFKAHAQSMQNLRIDLHAATFHGDDHGDQRTLQSLVDLLAALAQQARREDFV